MTDAAAQSGDGHTETIGLPNRPQPAAAPPHIPDYRLIKIIGRGAFGTVWLAEERLVGVYRAAKVLHREGKESSQIDRELAGVQTYQTHSQDHPHLVRILKTGLGRGNEDESARQVVYYVMEIADDAGGPRPHRPEDYLPSTLASLMRKEERLPVTKTLALADSLLQAIEHLHKAGVFHRDVKPSNVLFFDGALKLADPGLAALENVDHVGTSGYLTPEGKPDDLYAFGKILYQMTTGLTADCFPEWPADLDPTEDSRLSPMRSLINDLCHPKGEHRSDSIQETRRRLASLATDHSGPYVSRRAALATLVGGTSAGILGTKWWLKRSDPMKHLIGEAPYNGTRASEDAPVGERQFQLKRMHKPGVTYELPLDVPQAYTVVRFYDLQTRLYAGWLEVAGGYQIYNKQNPVRRDITDDRGEIDQIYLIVGDEMVLLYHGQPGAEPGNIGDFGARGERGIRLEDLAKDLNGAVRVYLAYRASASPEEAEGWYSSTRLKTFHYIQVAEVSWTPLSRPHDRQGGQRRRPANE